MWSIEEEKIEEWELFRDEALSESLKGSTILVTGATGLIGQALTKVLLYVNEKLYFRIKIMILVRSVPKAMQIFGNDYEKLQVICADINQIDDIAFGEIDYIIHGASITASKSFIEQPVETILTGVQGTNFLLQLAHKTSIKSMVYLSSMEVYGTHKEKEKLTEHDIGYLDPLVVRNSYPESKRMIESLCCSYASEYQVPVKIVRLAQTFGPGVVYEDERVFMDFARCAIEHKDIVMHSTGLSERMYLYVYDAVEAILYTLLRGQNGQAYNAANKDTYCSISQMADLVKSLTNDMIDVKVQVDEMVSKKYAPTHYLNLDTNALEKLGWKARTPLDCMYKKLIDSFE